jgi:hypothetical protein
MTTQLHQEPLHHAPARYNETNNVAYCIANQNAAYCARIRAVPDEPYRQAKSQERHPKILRSKDDGRIGLWDAVKN